MTAGRLGPGLAALAGHYDAFLIDQFGVMHDGVAPFPGVVACLGELHRAGGRIAILSNSGRRTDVNAARLGGMGIGAELYDAMVTSGEVVWQELHRRADPFFAGLGRRCLLFSNGGDRSVVDGLDIELVATVEAADFVLIAGLEPDATIDAFAPILEAARERDLPLICGNPDRVTVVGDDLGLGPGAVAEHYRELGGRVRLVGKPDPLIFEHCLAALGSLPDRRRVAVIGDSLSHDVAGGQAVGLATILITGGIHRAAFAGWSGGELPARVQAEAPGVEPDWLIPALRW